MLNNKKLKNTNWRSRLHDLARGNEEYAAFNKRIVNTGKEVIGVRVPDLRRLARQLAKTMAGADDFKRFLGEVDWRVFDEAMLAGLVLNAVKLSNEERIELAKQYLAKADSWAEIDIFAEKKARFATAEYWQFAVESIQDDREFVARYGVIAMMSNFLDDTHIDKVFRHLRQLKNDAYYVKMACAWLYATAAIDYYELTMTELERPEIDPWTRRKAYQKMLESSRLSSQQKTAIRTARDSLPKNKKGLHASN
ncbi:hypothetical protein CSA80_03200 [Candidatus Saccharibacteria bacterium]|nr:MAG: hypothetical protein CSA80_03200 [Candidatus Saccharibacteria bacterium]